MIATSPLLKLGFFPSAILLYILQIIKTRQSLPTGGDVEGELKCLLSIQGN